MLEKLLEIKDENKKELSAYLKSTQNLDIDPSSIFDIQIKRLHEYKRQQLNALYLIHTYLQIKKGIASSCSHYCHFRRKGGSGLCNRQGHHPSDLMSAAAHGF